MADLGFTVNVDDLPDNKDFSPVPLGKYTAIIPNSKLLPTNKTKEKMLAAGATDYDAFRKQQPGAEGFLALEFEIQDAPFQGRKIFHNLNLINDSKQAADIAAGQLKQILLALGMKTFSGKSEELHNKRLTIDVKVENGNDYVKDGVKKQGTPQNKITKFSAVGATGAASTTQVAQNTAASAMPKAPWSR